MYVFNPSYNKRILEAFDHCVDSSKLCGDEPLCVPGDFPKKRGRGRPRKSEQLARLRRAEVKGEEERNQKPPAPEEEEDDIVDAGAIDDPEGRFGIARLQGDRSQVVP